MKPEAVVDRLVAAYNAGDAEAVAALFAEDAVACEFPGEVTQQGRAAILDHYREAFRRLPRLRAELRHRVVLGDRVVDEERVDRGDGTEPFLCVAVYLLADGLIRRVETVRDPRHRPGA